MGTADYYCAICGISMGTTHVDIGSGSERAKRIRRKIIDAGLREGGSWQGRDKRIWWEVHQRPVGQAKDDTDDYPDNESGLPNSENAYGIEHSYDPEVMESRDSTLPNYDSWFKHVRLVMYDPDISKASSKHFISGPAEPDDFGWGTIDGGHPDRPDEQFENVLYIEWEPEEQTKSFPCHGLCLQIAAKMIMGSPDTRLFNPEALYQTMCELHRDEDDRFLDLDYGDISGQEQYWDCKAGEEFSIMNPLEFYDLHMQTLSHLTIEHKPNAEGISSIGTQRAITDPFEKLSNELIHHITSYLTGEAVFTLRQASMTVREATSGNSFWMPRVQKNLAWLWVPDSLFTRFSTIDWMKVYLLFDSATARPWGMRGVYLGLANRRRIWNACEDLKSGYLSHTAKSGQPFTNPNYGLRTWGLSCEVDNLWSEAWEAIESDEQWLVDRKQGQSYKV